MFDKRQTKWLLIIYSSFILLGIFVLLIICGINLVSWGSLYGWLLSVPFGFGSIISYTFIPKVLEKITIKKEERNRSTKVMLSLSMFIYAMRYLLFYITPLLIAGVANNWKIDGVFNMISTFVVIILIPLSSIALNFLLFYIDYYKSKKDQRGNEYVPTGDSLKTN